MVGFSGSGKSTIIQLIERFYDLSLGQLRLDDWNIQDLHLAGVRANISIVSQVVLQFTDTFHLQLYSRCAHKTWFEIRSSNLTPNIKEAIYDANLA